MKREVVPVLIVLGLSLLFSCEKNDSKKDSIENRWWVCEKEEMLFINTVVSSQADSDIQKIYFSEGNVTVVMTGGAKNVYPYSIIDNEIVATIVNPRNRINYTNDRVVIEDATSSDSNYSSIPEDEILPLLKYKGEDIYIKSERIASLIDESAGFAPQRINHSVFTSKRVPCFISNLGCSCRISVYELDEYNKKYKNSSFPAPSYYSQQYETFSIETSDNGFIVHFWYPESDDGMKRGCYEYHFTYNFICDTRRISFKPE